MLIKLANGAWVVPEAVTAVIPVISLESDETTLDKLEVHLTGTIMHCPVIDDVHRTVDDLAKLLNKAIT